MGCCDSKPVEMKEILDRCCPPTANALFSEKIETINGSSRNVANWQPKSGPTRAVVIIAHGLLEHALCYYNLALALAEAGYAVYIMDYMGHGLSDGPRGLLSDRHKLVADFVAFANKVLEANPAIPAFLLGHSTGTFVSMAAINKLHGIHALILSGVPFFPGWAAASPFGLKCLYPLSQTAIAPYLAATMAVLAPQGLLAPLIEEECIHDKEEVKLRGKDPRRCKGVIFNKTGLEILRMNNELREILPSIKLPVLIMHGEDDQICLLKGSHFLYVKIGTDISHRRIEVFPGMLHEVFHDTHEEGRSSAKCIAMVVDYCDAHLKLLL